MNKYLINTALILASICTICLLFVEPLSLWFFILYLICGGCYVFKCCTNRALDNPAKSSVILTNVSKYLFVIAILAVFIPLIQLTHWQLYWLVAILLIRISALLVGYIRYHRLAFWRTYSNSAKRIAFFCFPLLYGSLGFTIAICVFCGIATISAAEDLLLNSTAKELDPAVKSYFLGRKKEIAN